MSSEQNHTEDKEPVRKGLDEMTPEELAEFRVKKEKRRQRRRKQERQEFKSNVKTQLQQERIAKRAQKQGVTVEEFMARKQQEKQQREEEIMKRLATAKTAVKVSNVGMEFNLGAERVEDLKSYIINTLKGKKNKKNRFWALKDVSFEIKQGERIGILGLNGAGKSTLLKIVAGVLKPTEGTVKVKGVIAPMLELGAGFDKRYTGAENIYLNGAMLGYSKEFIKEKFDEIVEFSELGEFINVPLMNYSSGMKARLGFAMATIVEPDILILDEVLAVGDARFRRKSEAKIHEMLAKNVTVLFVSHNIEQIKRICDTAILLEKGKLLMKGPVKEVAEVYEAKINEM